MTTSRVSTKLYIHPFIILRPQFHVAPNYIWKSQAMTEKGVRLAISSARIACVRQHTRLRGEGMLSRKVADIACKVIWDRNSPRLSLNLRKLVISDTRGSS